MATSDNPYRNSVELDTENMKVKVSVIERASGNEVESGEFQVKDIPENLRPHVALYGVSKLLQDRTSETPTGPGKLEAMNQLWEQFKAGIWEKPRQVGSPVVSAEVEALAELKGISVAQAQAALRKYDKETREKILSHETITKRAQEIRATRENASAVDLGDLV